jgi:hypothetical protein
MSDEVSACEACREEIDPDDPSIAHAVEIVDVRTMGDTAPNEVDGLGVFFHERCFPSTSRKYRRTN